MNSESKPARVLYQDLDTSFVNLWALLRYLSQRSFIGRVHVELEKYTADVFLNGSKTPLVHEVDQEAGSDVIEEAALHRLVLRVRESPGSISVYEGEAEAVAPRPAEPAEIKSSETEPTDEMTVVSAAEPEPVDDAAAATAASMSSTPLLEESLDAPSPKAEPTNEPATEEERNEMIRASAEVIAGVDRATTSSGADFASLFREASIALADDYTFLDPMAGEFRYENFAVSVTGDLPAGSFVAGISEALRRVVDEIATGDRARRTRERVALELARVARKNDNAVTRSGFKAQLDRIAGTKVI